MRRLIRLDKVNNIIDKKIYSESSILSELPDFEGGPVEDFLGSSAMQGTDEISDLTESAPIADIGEEEKIDTIETGHLEDTIVDGKLSIDDPPLTLPSPLPPALSATSPHLLPD